MNSSEMKKTILEIIKSNNFNEMADEVQAVDENVGLKIGFVGEYDTGKSTIINSLLKEDLLPVKDTPANKTIAEIRASENENYLIYKSNKNNSESESVNRKKFKKMITEEDSEVIKGEAYILPRQILKDQVVLVDTPGLLSLEKLDDEITYGYLPFCDVIFIVHELADGSLKKSARNFIEERSSQTDSKIRLILNKEDQVAPNNREKIYNEFKEEFRKFVDDPVIFQTSAKAALDDRLLKKEKKDSISAIEEHIEKQVLPEMKNILEKNLKNRFSEIAANLIDRLEKKEDIIKWKDEEIDKRIDELELEIADFNRKESKIGNEFDVIKLQVLNNIHLIVEKYSAEFMEMAQQKEESIFQSKSEQMTVEIENEIKKGVEKLSELSKKDFGVDLVGKEGIRVDADLVSTELLVQKVAVLATSAVVFAYLMPGAFGPMGELSLPEGGIVEYLKNLEIQEWAAKGLPGLPAIAEKIGKQKPVEELIDYGVDAETISKLKEAGYVTMKDVVSETTDRLSKKVFDSADNPIDEADYLKGICEDNKTREGNKINGLKKLAGFIDKINPIAFAGRKVTNFIGQPKFKEEIMNRLITSLEFTFQEIEDELRSHVKSSIINPRKRLQVDLEEEKKAREKNLRKKEQYQNELLEDINILKKTKL